MIRRCSSCLFDSFVLFFYYLIAVFQRSWGEIFFLREVARAYKNIDLWVCLMELMGIFHGYKNKIRSLWYYFTLFIHDLPSYTFKGSSRNQYSPNLQMKFYDVNRIFNIGLTCEQSQTRFFFYCPTKKVEKWLRTFSSRLKNLTYCTSSDATQSFNLYDPRWHRNVVGRSMPSLQLLWSNEFISRGLVCAEDTKSGSKIGLFSNIKHKDPKMLSKISFLWLKHSHIIFFGIICLNIITWIPIWKRWLLFHFILCKLKENSFNLIWMLHFI